MLTWSSTNATSCSATGAWSGGKATSGSQSTGPLTTSSSFSLSCSGPDGSASASAQVSVTGTPSAAPTLSISANPMSVASGGSSTITWSATNAASCIASGSWSGAKGVSGSQTINSIVATSTYILSCIGSGGSTTRSAIVSVTGGAGTGVSGAVDSSLLSRHQESANLMYAFTGFNTTSGTPVSTAPVTQNVGTCTFGYDLGGLPNGSYTVALTKDGGTTFSRSANVTVAGSAVVQNFAPTRVRQVGPGRTFTHPSAVTGLQSGDVVEIDAGIYDGPATTWVTSNITLRGVGGRAHIRASAGISNGKAIWVTQGSNIAVENIEFSGASVPDLNGAGIRIEGRDLTVCSSYFHDNQDGILGNANVGNVLIEYSEFARNGHCIGKCSHNMYIGNTDRFTLRYSYSHHAHIGHTVKSRARENYILYNRIMDEADGDSSYIIDLPNGGLSYIIGNVIQKGPFTDNTWTMVTYGEEGLSNANRMLYVVNNTMVNEAGASNFIDIVSGSNMALVQNNLFVGPGTTVRGSATSVANRQTTAPNFVDRGAFDYRPTASTPGIDGGTAPGIGDGFDLTPIYQYLHPHNREARPVRNAIDTGAYELP